MYTKEVCDVIDVMVMGCMSKIDAIYMKDGCDVMCIIVSNFFIKRLGGCYTWINGSNNSIKKLIVLRCDYHHSQSLEHKMNVTFRN